MIIISKMISVYMPIGVCLNAQFIKYETQFEISIVMY